MARSSNAAWMRRRADGSSLRSCRCGDSVAVAHEVHGFVLDTGPVDDLGQFLSRLRHTDFDRDRHEQGVSNVQFMAFTLMLRPTRRCRSAQTPHGCLECWDHRGVPIPVVGVIWKLPVPLLVRPTLIWYMPPSGRTTLQGAATP